MAATATRSARAATQGGGKETLARLGPVGKGALCTVIGILAIQLATGDGRAGYAARSVVFVLIGWFFVQAAAAYDPDEAEGLSGTLQELSGEGWSRALLWVVAIGLLAFGLSTLAEARYRRSA